MAAILRKLWRWSWAAIAIGLIAAAVLLTLLRLLVPFAGEYKAELEDLLGDYLGAPVVVGEFDVEWRGLGPRLRLERVAVLRPDGEAMQFDQAYVDFRLGLGQPGAISIRNVALAGVTVDARIDEAGRIRFWGTTIDPKRLQEAMFAEERDPAGWDEAAAALVDGLLAVDRLQVLDTRLRVVAADGTARPAVTLDVHLLNQGSRHRISVDIRPPPDWGDRLRVVVDARNLRGPPGGWTASAHVEGRGLDPRPGYAWLVGSPPAGGITGQADVEAWIDWRDTGVETVRGRVDLRSVHATTADGETVRFDALGGLVDWQRGATGWSLRGADLYAERGGRSWEPGGFAVERRDAADAPGWSASFGFLRADDLLAFAPFLPAPDGLLAALDGHAPAGDLHDVDLRFDDDGDFAVSGTFADAGWAPVGPAPGMRGLSGRFRLTPVGGRIWLDSTDVVFSAPRLFRDPLRLDRIEAELRVIRDDSEWILAANDALVSNADIETRSRLEIVLAQGRSPWLDIETDFRDGDGSTTSRYLPVGIMHPNLVNWLDTAIVDGHVTGGRFGILGYASDFPYTGEGQGHFDVDFELRDATLRYHEDWPAITDLAARVHFHGEALDIHARSARIIDSEIVELDARFANLRDGVLEIDGAVDGSMNGMIRVVNESPLARQIGGFFAGAVGAGDAHVDLELHIPVRDADRTRVAGSVLLQGSTLRQPRFGLDFTELVGRIHFTEDSVSIRGMPVTLNGQAVNLGAVTANGEVRFLVDGMMAPAAMLPDLAGVLGEWFEGAAAWSLQVAVRGVDDAGMPERVRIDAHSDLVGTRVGLPAPLDKAADVARPTRVSVDLARSDNHHHLRLWYGDDLLASADLAAADTAGATLDRLSVHFGAEARDPPVEPGLTLTGRVETLDLSGWTRVLAGLPDRPGAGAGSPIGLLAGIDLHVGRLQWQGQQITALDLRAEQRNGVLRLDFTGDEVGGRVEWPHGRDAAGKALHIRLERLDLARLLEDEDRPPGADTAPADYDPAALPPLDVRIDHVLWDDILLRNVVLVTTPTSEGMTVHRLGAGNGHLALEGQGEWTRRGARARTNLRVELTTDNFGSGLREIGIDSAFLDGEGRITFDLAWSGSPWTPDLASLNGQMRIRLDDGFVTAVDTGPARLIGLFSLEALPRRLALDFRGLLRRGFDYDRVRGRINLHNGNAYTNDLEMRGPPGRMIVSGRTGYVDEDFDQQIVFRPQLKSSLPLIGALAGGPAAGIAVAVVENMMRTLGADIETATELHYTLTGTWADPKVERVRIGTSDAVESPDPGPSTGR